MSKGSQRRVTEGKRKVLQKAENPDPGMWVVSLSIVFPKSVKLHVHDESNITLVAARAAHILNRSEMYIPHQEIKSSQVKSNLPKSSVRFLTQFGRRVLGPTHRPAASTGDKAAQPRSRTGSVVTHVIV